MKQTPESIAAMYDGTIECGPDRPTSFFVNRPGRNFPNVLPVPDDMDLSGAASEVPAWHMQTREDFAGATAIQTSDPGPIHKLLGLLADESKCHVGYVLGFGYMKTIYRVRDKWFVVQYSAPTPTEMEKPEAAPVFDSKMIDKAVGQLDAVPRDPAFEIGFVLGPNNTFGQAVAAARAGHRVVNTSLPAHSYMYYLRGYKSQEPVFGAPAEFIYHKEALRVRYADGSDEQFDATMGRVMARDYYVWPKQTAALDGAPTPVKESVPTDEALKHRNRSSFQMGKGNNFAQAVAAMFAGHPVTKENLLGTRKMIFESNLHKFILVEANSREQLRREVQQQYAQAVDVNTVAIGNDDWIVLPKFPETV